MILGIYGRLPKGGFTQMGLHMLNLLKAQLNYANILELTTSNCLLLVTRQRTHQFFAGINRFAVLQLIGFLVESYLITFRVLRIFTMKHRVS